LRKTVRVREGRGERGRRVGFMKAKRKERGV
jgi:hypothetical protein